jgi:betaine lipid synthase
MMKSVLRGLSERSLTRALIMDHLDWFAPGSSDVDEEVAELHRVLAPGGFVFWRSAARKPWYNANFKRKGFQVTALGVRKGKHGQALDRVNMCVFSCFWRYW